MTQKGVFICWGIAIILMGAFVYLFNQPTPDSVITPPPTLSSEATPPTFTLPIPETTSEATPETQPPPSTPATEESPATFGSTLTGRIFNVATDEGIEGVGVTANSLAGGIRLSKKTDMDGTYTFSNLPLGQYNIHPSNPDRWGTLPSHSLKSQALTITEVGEISGPDFPIDYGISFSGQVTNSENSPLQDVILILHSGSAPLNLGYYPPGIQQAFRHITNDQGKFTITGLSPASDMKLMAIKTGYARKTISGININPSGQDDFHLSLEKEASISGIVVDKNGKPVHRINVIATDENSSIVSIAHYASFNMSPPAPFGLTESYSDLDEKKDGRFSINPLASGTYRLYAHQEMTSQKKLFSSRIYAPPSFKDTPPHATITVESGEQIKGLRLEMDIEQPTPLQPGEEGTITLAGKIIDLAGNPIAKAHVISDNITLITSNAQGHYSVTLPYDTTQPHSSLQRQASFSVRADEYNPTFISKLTESKNDLDITLYKSIHVSGRVIDAQTKKPIPQFKIGNCSPNDSRPIPSTSLTFVQDAQGEFTTGVLPNRETALIAMSEGYAPKIIPIQTQADDITEIEIELHPSDIIEGVVLSPTGEPVSGANISLTVNSGTKKNTSTHITQSDPKGLFILTSVPTDTSHLGAESSDFGFASTPVSTGPNQKQKVYIRFGKTSGSTIEGQVTYHNTPLSNQSIEISVEHQSQQFQTDKNGWYKATNLKPGEARIYARLKWDNEGLNNIRQEATFTLEPDQTVRQDFTIPEYDTHLFGAITFNTPIPDDLKIIAHCGNRNDGNGQGPITLDPNGHFDVKHLLPGGGNIIISGTNISKLQPFTLIEGEPLELNIQVGEPTILHGTFTAKGSSGGNYHCYYGTPKLDQLYNAPQVHTGDLSPTDTYKILVPIPGTYTLVAYAFYGDRGSKQKTLVETITLEEGDNAEINFEFQEPTGN